MLCDVTIPHCCGCCLTQIMSLQWVFMLTFVGNYSIALIMQLVWFRKIAWGAFKVIGLVGGEKAEIQKDPLKKG